MKETQITAKIVEHLNGIPGTFAKKRHSGKFGSGDPDIAGCHLGRAFVIETKVAGGELTQLQAIQLERWRKAGAINTLAVFLPETKVLRMITLHHTEKWADFTGHQKLKELIETSVANRYPLKGLDLQPWLEAAEFHAEKEGY